MPTYRIEVYTGSRSTAALGDSDASIFLTLFGTSASTDELTLDPGSSEPSAVDTFSLQLGELGEVSRLRVRHDDAGLGRAWYLDRIAIRNEESGREWTFPCNRWLARHEDDGEIERTLDAMRTRGQPQDEIAER
ncbi:MAG TPA: PLAT/LH2 domain-containing protein [Acidimicrobiales bacterium]|jgi:hypothetical protein